MIELDPLDITFAEQELFEGAVAMGKAALKANGVEPLKSSRVEREYRQRDCARLERQRDRRPARRLGDKLLP